MRKIGLVGPDWVARSRPTRQESSMGTGLPDGVWNAASAGPGRGSSEAGSGNGLAATRPSVR